MEGNKIIAEFMGAVGTPKYNPTHWDIYITGCLDVDSDNENAKHFYTPEEMEYHTSSNWLNPVLDKVWSMEGGARAVCVDWSDSHEEVYDSILDFIKDLNK
tara:strand:- start:462 stop:764 length:303 start_codon:yes stop_codon:yes gene_type:complete